MKGLWSKKNILVVLASYITLYLVLSRIGFQWAKAIHSRGFYFVYPTGTVSAVANYTCVVVFYPLIVVDNLLGTGMSYDRESNPDWTDSKNRAATEQKGCSP